MPLVTRNGKLGTLNVGSAEPAAFSSDDVTLLGQTSAQIAIAVENARAYQEIAQLNAQLIDEKQYLEGELHHEFAEIVGRSPALRRVLKAVKTVAPTDSTVLLLGETGTGKELIARAIHTLSPRRERTFVRVNWRRCRRACSRASCSGTRRARSRARRRAAPAGSSWPTAARCSSTRSATFRRDVQPKLLRVLQEREFERVGSTRTSASTCASWPRRTATSNAWSKRDVPKRSLLSPQRVPDPRAAAARARRGHSAAGALTSRRSAPGAWADPIPRYSRPP